MKTSQTQVSHDRLPTTNPIPGNPEWVEVLRGGDRIRIRQLHRDDKAMVRRFIEGLSSDLRYFRFRESMLSPSDSLLRLLTEMDPKRNLAYVAVIDDRCGNTEVGAARFAADADGLNCEFAIVVDDRWQMKGVGTSLMRHLIDAARDRGILRMSSSDAADNHLMRRFAAHLNLHREADPLDPGQTVYSVVSGPSKGTADVHP